MFYDYKCKEHGIFTIQRPMNECSLPVYCSKCGEECKRIFSPINWVWGLGGWDFDQEGMGNNLIRRHND